MASRWQARCFLACCLSGGLLAGAQERQPSSEAVLGFEQLWRMVVVGQAHRGVDLGDVAQVRRVCQYGLTQVTAEIAASVLLQVEPNIEVLELLDTDASVQGLLAEVAALAGPRLQLAVDSGLPSPGDDRPGAALERAGPGICDMAIFSEAAPKFSIDRLLPRLGQHVVVVWVSEYCVAEEGDEAGPVCNLLNTMWEKTLLMRRGYCTKGVCAARVPSKSLVDPNTLPLECERFMTETGSNTSVSEFGQDWFAYWNFFRGGGAPPGGGGVYVDVGASLPFEYSNTVIFDRCLGWRGVCIEPNPHLVAFLEAYRSCEVVPHCIDEAAASRRPFTDREGNVQFTADCLSLGEILDRAGLAHQRIDVLSIDVEHGELNALRGMELDRYDIRVIIVEVTRGARWLEVESAILPFGYAKVAVLGRDVVYAKLEDLSGFAPAWPVMAEPAEASGPRAVLPQTWSHFHQRVIDEELEAEMRHERAAFYAGLRRTL